MQNQFGNDQLVMHNDPTDCFKSLTFLKENNISPSAILQNLLYHFFKDLRKYLFYLLIEIIVVMCKTS